MNELAFALWLTAYYLDMASECEDTPECRAFFVKDQAWGIGQYSCCSVLRWS